MGFSALLLLTFVASQVADGTRIIIGAGLTANGLVPSFEILDLELTQTSKPNITDLPKKMYKGVSGVDPYGRRFVCHYKCYSLDDSGSWNEMSEMTFERAEAAVIRHPTNPNETIISGGLWGTSQVSAIEVLGEEGTWHEFPVDLPYEPVSHCMVNLDSDRIMTIGGDLGPAQGGASNATFILDVTKEKWEPGPILQRRRSGHACGRIRTKGEGQGWSTIVIGGNSREDRTSSEILDDGASSWRYRESPYESLGLSGALLLEEKAGSILLIGGHDTFQYSNAIYRLKHAEDTWTLIDVKISQPRSFFVGWILEDDTSFSGALSHTQMNWLILSLLLVTRVFMSY